MLNSFADIDLFFAKRAFPEANESEKIFLATLMAVSRQGNLCLHIDNNQIAPSLEFLTADPEHLNHLKEKVIEGSQTLPKELHFIKQENNRWYLKRNWNFETKFIHHLERLKSAQPKISIKDPGIIEGLNSEQNEALKKALTQTFSLISGGPGTGKSYVASHLVTQFLLASPENTRIVLAAPTGKAAAHLASKMPKDARIRSGTLHMLLKLSSSSQLNGEKGYLGADLLIVDESSMIDAPLFSYLLASLESGTRIVLMGDEEQLPPVEVGSLFADLIEAVKSGFALSSSHLNKCMRSDRLEILQLAESIKKGYVENLEIEAVDPLCLHHYFRPPSFDMPKYEESQSFSILSCMRQGPLGVDLLNQLIVSQLLSQAKQGQYFVAPIIITKNDYAQKLYNGQTGVLVRRIGYESEDKVLFSDRELPFISLSHFEYAYVISVHKSQGSEYDHVLLIVPPGSEVFGRELLYTAVTRARNKIEIKGDRQAFLQALTKSSRKISGLKVRTPPATSS